MRFLARFKYLWPSRRRREEREMQEELRSLTEIAGPAELGNLTQAMENVRATWGWTWLDSIAADIRYSLRALRHQPAFVTVAVLSLAVAIGANSAIFSFADALLLRPLPVPSPSNLLDVINTTPDNPFEGMSYPDFRDFRNKTRSWSGLAAYRLTTVAAASDAAAPARIRLAMLVSDNFFPVIGVAPSVGRAFLPEESDAPGQAAAIISYDFWQEQYSGNRAAIGATLRLNGIACTIVGVAPESFTGLDRFSRPSLFVPLRMSQRLAGEMTDPLEDRGRHELVVKGRLISSSSPKMASAELATIGADLEREYPKTNHNRRPTVRAELARRIQQTPQLLALTKMLMGLVGLILLVACSNLANLMLAKGRVRSREIAIRLSIGAGRARLLRQLMTESLIVAIAGGIAGLIFAYGGILLLQTMDVPSDPPAPLGVQLDWRVVKFSLAAALASCILFGLVPAWRTVRTNLAGILKSDTAGASGQRRTLGRDVLVTSQIALAMVVLIAAGMFVSGFQKMLVTRPEFRTDHLVSMDTAPAMLHYSPEQTKAFYRQLVDRARAVPGVAKVSLAESLPLAVAQSVVSVVPEGYQLPQGREQVVALGGAADGDFFSIMDVEITRGRAFTKDDRRDTGRVAIVNQQFAQTYWPNQNAIGKRIRLAGGDGVFAEVVGVAKTGHYVTVNEAPASYVYLPYEQNPRQRMTLIVQSTADPVSLSAQLRDVIRSLDPDLPIFNFRPVATLYKSRATDTWLQFSEMVGTMGFIGLVLATTGLYGLVAYTVSRRVKELGIRVALGASRSNVIWLVERRGLILAGIGILIGGGLSVLAAPMLSAAFFGIGTSSLVVYVLVPLLLLFVSAAASFLPARRAAGVDPLTALRNE